MRHPDRPNDPRLAQLFDTALELIEVIEIENGHLDARKPARLGETEKRKEGLVGSYRQQITGLSRAGAAGQLSEHDRRSLRAVGTRLEDVMADHARKVVRLKSVTEGLVQAIAEEANRGRRQVDGYGSSGRRQSVTVARSAYTRPQALSLNRTI